MGTLTACQPQPSQVQGPMPDRCPRGLLCPVTERLFILLGLGLPGTGYQVDKKPGVSGGENQGLQFSMFYRADCLDAG